MALSQETSVPDPLQVQGLPLVKPPYGVISAVDMDKGELLWQVPYGETPDNVRNNPALKGLHLGNTGQGGSVGLDGQQDAGDPGR